MRGGRGKFKGDRGDNSHEEKPGEARGRLGFFYFYKGKEIIMEKKNIVYRLRLDPESDKCLEEFAKATNRTKAQAARAAFQIVASLFVRNASMGLETQAHKEANPVD